MKNAEQELLQREQKLHQIKTMTDQEIRCVSQQLREEHQNLIYQITKAPIEERSKWQALLEKNQTQQNLLQNYQNIRYQKLIKGTAPKKPVLQNTLRAFVIGGTICTIGQIMIELCKNYTDLTVKQSAGMASVVIVVLTAILTGLGIYDEIGRFGGAGSMVPISGFANSIVSAALEFKREGMVYGIGAKIFTVAGPVILYGLISSVIIGLIWTLGGYI